MIKELDPRIVAQISAGEVVERPTNIVKELVENSIDAGATRIVVTIENGGLEMIRVTDDGSGIVADQIELAFKLHTTSKVLSDDLFSIPTLGFRGEALASIAAISMVECKSRKIDELGRILRIEGGKVVKNEEINCPEGTSVHVSGIFYNTPARRGFLKAASTERRRLMNLIMSYCLMYPAISFTLDEIVNKQNKRRLESPARQSMLSAAFDVLGSDIASQLMKISTTLGDWQIDGFISKPIITRKDRSMQFICINGRPVQHREIQQAIEKAYGSQLMRSTHPVVIVNIRGPVDGVDYNIHPRKSEVRFRTDDTIIDEIGKATADALKQTWELPKLPPRKLDRIKTGDRKPKQNYSEVKIKSTIDEVFESEIPEAFPVETSSSTIDEVFAESVDGELETPVRDIMGSEKPVIAGRRVLGHIMKKFAVIDAGNELWLMDVHAADERVKFEMYERQSNREILSQTFFSPISLTMPVVDKQAIMDNAELLQTFGLKITDGGGSNLMVHSVPVFFKAEYTAKGLQKMLHEILDELEDGEKMIETLLSRREYAIVANLACHGSIRSGHHVDDNRIAEVLGDLMKCENPWTCAHGRPTVLRIETRNFESWFKR